MLEREENPHWRWASLAAVATLLILSLFFLGSHMAAAQYSSLNQPNFEQTDGTPPAASSPTHGLSPVQWIPPSPKPMAGQAFPPTGWRPNSGAPAFAASAQPQRMAPLTPPLPKNVDLAICQSTDRVWGVVGAGETVTVTVGGAQMGAALSDGVGFFWTTLYKPAGDQPDLSGGETVSIYREGSPMTSLTLRPIGGNIDVSNDTVFGSIGGSGFPIDVTVYIATNEPNTMSYSQTVSTDGSGAFTADFGGTYDLVTWHYAMVAYTEGGVEVHKHLYPTNSLMIRPAPWNSLMGTSFAGPVVTATVYAPGWSMKVSQTLDVDPVTGWYRWDEPGDLLAGDIVVVDLASGWAISRTIETLSMAIDPVSDQITGQAVPGQIVAGAAGGVTPNGWLEVTTEAKADAGGAYALDFSGLIDIMPGSWAAVFAPDAEGDILSLLHNSPSVEVHQTQNRVTGQAPAPSPPEAPGRMVTLTLSSDPTIFTTEMGFGGWYDFDQETYGLPDIGPGEIVTVEAEGFAWQGVVEVNAMSVGHDVDADQFTGTVQPPSDRVELYGYQWQSESGMGSLYPVGGVFDTVATASSAFTASPAGFDVRNAVEYDARHRTADDYLETVHNQVDFLRVWPQYNGTLGSLGPPGTAFTLTLRQWDGTFKAEVTGISDEPTGSINWQDFWPTGEQLLPGDQLHAQSAAGFDQIVHIPDIIIHVEETENVVSGSAPPNSLLYVQMEGDQGLDRGWVPTGADGGFAVAVDQLQQVEDGDLETSDWIMVCYVNEDANHVCRSYEQPWARVNYGHDWVGANYPAGHTFWITVTESDETTVKGLATMDSEPGGGWGGDGFETWHEHWLGGEPPDILPGDWVFFRSDDGYNHSLHVGTVEGTVDTDTDSVSGPIDVPWFVGSYALLDIECHPWGAPDPNTPGKNSVAGPAGVPQYLCEWDPNTEWDVQPGQEIAVMYIEPDDGDRVMNVLRDPAPDMHVEKWPEGSDQVAAGGYAVFTIRYRNEGDLPAPTVLLTDTLPPGTSYVSDSSGAPRTFGTNTVTWDLGAVDVGQERQFQLVVEIPASPDPTLLNQADIWAAYDFNDWNDHAEAEVYVTGDVWYDPNVHKQPEPNEPAPGGTYVYEIDYGNNGPVPTGPSTLTDILPPGTSVVDWYSENGYGLWTEVSRNGQLILETPTLPGYWGDRIILRLAVAPTVEVDTQLTNTVELDIPVGFASHTRDDVWVRGPYWDAHVNKHFDWGTLVPGHQAGFNVHMRNGSNQPAQTWLTDTLPVGTSLAESWRWDGQQHIEWPPIAQIGQEVIWDMGVMLPGQWYNLDVRLDIDSGVPPNTDLENCVQIGVDGDDRNPFNDQDCVTVTVREPGTNMRVYKEHEWQDDGNVLRYQIRVENVGTERLENVLIYDIYPEFTTFNGEWWVDHGPWIEIDSHNPGSRELVFWAEQFGAGETASINFRVDLDDPGARPRWYTNTVEIPVIDDVWPADNVHQDVAVKGELGRVELWIEPYGHSNMWGEAEPGAQVTVTTPVSQVTTIVGDPECDRCWGIGDVGPLEPGDIVIVESGLGLLPVIVEIPDPFDANASSSADTVSGQVGGWIEDRLEIHGQWPDSYQEVLTDGSGNFLVSYDDVPPRADGYIRFQTWIDFAEVIFHRPFQDMDPIMDMNYDHDWVSANYPPDHTIWLTLTDSLGAIKDTAQVVTGPVPEWDEGTGLQINMPIDPDDWVYARVDIGNTSSVQVGTISGAPSAHSDNIRGTVDAKWISQQVDVECHPWGAGHPAPNKHDTVLPNGSDLYYCEWDPDTEWDIEPEQDIGVSYDDPTGHRIYAAFQVRGQIYLPTVLKNP